MMNILLRYGLAVVLLLLASAPWTAELEELAGDAQGFERELLKETASGPVEALLRSAEVMSEAKDCGSAVKLRMQAMRMGGASDAAAWLGLAGDAACAKDWETASRAGWLALRFPMAQKERLQVWANLGHALESRGNWNEDWKPAAMEAFEKILAEKDVPWVRQRLAKLREAVDSERFLRVEGIRIDGEGASPGVCLQFNDQMPAADAFRYADYIRFQPAFDAVYKVGWNDVCAYGGQWDMEYRITLLQGLKGEGRQLERHLERVAESGARPPALWFDRNAYVLQKDGASEAPLHVINTPNVELRLLRIHERNLLTPFVRNHFQQRLTRYQLDQIVDGIGEEVWRGTMEASGEPNQAHRAWIELPKSVGAQPGLYLLAARDAEDDTGWKEFATQWLVVNDLGLTAYHGAEALTLSVRRLSDAAPAAGVELALMARNNEPLARSVTDAQGRARFSAGLLKGEAGRAAVQVTAFGDGLGFGFLSLDKPAFDLSDRGVDGRAAPGPLDAWLQTERGVYRPGETAYLTALLRNRQGRAVSGLPLTLKLLDPSGDPALERVLQPDEAGGYVTAVYLSDGARTGRWALTLHADPEGAAIGRTDFLVEQIVPPRMEVELAADGVLRPGEAGEARVNAQYLFGAPAAERPVRAELFLEADPDPFPEYSGYRFGMDGERIDAEWQELAKSLTDGQGKARLTPRIAAPPSQRVPLRARIRAEVMDVDGRVVAAETRIPVRHLPLYIGVRPDFDGDRAPARQQVAFDVIGLGEDGAARARAGLRWRLVAEEWEYQWFRKGGSWAYERVPRERPAGEGRIDLAGDAPAKIRAQVERGGYRLEVSDAASDTAAVIRFHAGQQIVAAYDTPDAVKVTLDRASYLPGDTARLTIEAPFDGRADLVLAGERIHSLEAVALPGGKGELVIPVGHDWGAGAYALITVYRPGEGDQEGAGRAIGVAWIGVEPRAQTLSLDFTLPESVRPRRSVTIPVAVAGLAPGESAQLTLAAVDEGVLQLTDFASPDPLGYYFGKRRLGVDVRDIHGRLIERRDQRPDHLRQGADTSGRRGMPPSNVEIVSLFSGPLTVGADGNAEITLELPDYNGRLRLMAIAWTRDKIGASAAPLTVRDPVVVMPTLPRFMALGDQSELTLLLNNMNGPAGGYGVTVTGDEIVTARRDEPLRFDLAAGARHVARIPLIAEGLGQGKVKVTLDGPEGYRYDRTLSVGVRGRFFPIHQRHYEMLAPGERFEIGAETVAGLHRETASVTLTLSPQPALDVRGLLKDLRHYPYGCLEQTTSRGFAMLYANELAERWGGEAVGERDPQLESSIRRILDMQRGDGAFGLWSAREAGEEWLSAYAMEFLTRARQRDLEVTDYFYERGLEYLADLVGDSYREEPGDLAAKAYAHYVLALAGRARPEEARYLLDMRLERLPTVMANAQLGAAMALMGDRQRARKAFQRAVIGFERRSLWRDYGTPLRDLAAVLALLSEHGQGVVEGDFLWRDLTLKVADESWISTQEKAWLLLAARGLSSAREMTLAVDGGEPVTQAVAMTVRLQGGEIDAGKGILNRGEEAIWLVNAVEGTPLSAPVQEDMGFTIQREWFDLAGQKVSPTAIPQGELLMAVISGRVESRREHRALVVDLLPAGFEIENPRLADALDPADFGWLPELSEARYIDALDDRFVAALDVRDPSDASKPRHFTLAYLLRAVTPGDYFASPVEIEDMYLPRFRARGEGRPLRVVAPQ